MHAPHSNTRLAALEVNASHVLKGAAGQPGGIRAAPARHEAVEAVCIVGSVPQKLVLLALLQLHELQHR